MALDKAELMYEITDVHKVPTERLRRILNFLETYIDTAERGSKIWPYVAIQYRVLITLGYEAFPTHSEEQEERERARLEELVIGDYTIIDDLAGHFVLQDYARLWEESPQELTDIYIKLELSNFHEYQIFRLGNGVEPEYEIQTLRRVMKEIEEELLLRRNAKIAGPLPIFDINSGNFISGVLSCHIGYPGELQYHVCKILFNSKYAMGQFVEQQALEDAYSIARDIAQEFGAVVDKPHFTPRWLRDAAIQINNKVKKIFGVEMLEYKSAAVRVKTESFK